MDLQLPQREKPGKLSFNTAPAALTAWLNNLPLVNTGRSLELLDSALQQINPLILPPQNRQQALGLFTTPVMCITDALKKKFLDQPLPLTGNNLLYATQTLELYNQMATGYRILVDDLHHNTADKQQLTIAVHRALRYLSEILLTSYRIYIQYPEGLWKTINTLYALADESRITRQMVTDITLQTPATNTIETIYKQILLLSLACPYRLRQHEIHVAYNTLMDWADSSQLCQSTADSTHGLFSVNLQSDTPPSYRALDTGAAPDSHTRFLDTSSMADRLRENLATARDSTNQQPGSGNTETMQRLLLAWGVMPKRRFARHPQDAPVKLVIGLNAIHKLALGPVIEAADTDESIRDQHYLQDPTFEAITQITTDPFASKDFQQTAVKDRSLLQGAYAADKLTSSRIESWKIADISAGGYCLLWDSDKASCAQVGELVALIEAEYSGSDKWQLGAIRRMKFTKERGLELGIELLSPGARPVWTSLCKNGLSTSDRMPGILLPGIEAIRQQASLLLSSLPFRSSCTTTLVDNGKTTTVNLTRQLENTGSFAQYHFTSQ